MANEAGLLLGIKHKINEDIHWNELKAQEADQARDQGEYQYRRGVIAGMRGVLAYIPGKRGGKDT